MEIRNQGENKDVLSLKAGSLELSLTSSDLVVGLVCVVGAIAVGAALASNTAVCQEALRHGDRFNPNAGNFLPNVDQCGGSLDLPSYE
ncbi:hypothetical protein [Shewanella mangrovi]|nr:hypothetical protein [Shewanella mangrovi]